MPTKPQWTKQLETLRACKEAVVWASQYPSLAEAWAVCERGDWMLWLVARTMGNKLRSTLVLAACECARLALPYVADGERRPLEAIETAEKWARGEAGITIERVRSAAADAYAADAYAAYAAYAAAYAAYAAAYAAYTAAYAADAADDAGMETLNKCAAIVRKYYLSAPQKTQEE